MSTAFDIFQELVPDSVGIIRIPTKLELSQKVPTIDGKVSLFQ